MNKHLVFACLAVLLSACNAKKPETPMGKPDMPHSSYCVGRSTIIMPSPFNANPIVSAQIKLASMGKSESSIEVLVRSDHVPDNKIALEVAKRRTELMDRTSGEVEVLRVEKAIDRHTTLFRVQWVEDAYTSEVLLFRDGNVIRANLQSFHNTYELAERRLLEFAESIAMTGAITAVDSLHGFCLGSVIVTGSLSSEAGSFAFEDGRGSTFGVAIDTYAEDAQVPLLARVSGPDSLLTVFDVDHHVLRSGERTVAGMKAQEWLGRAKVGEHQEAFAFSMETMRAAPGKNAPKIHLSFDTGERLPNGELPGKIMTDDEAVKLWDVVVGSIRPAA